MDVPRKGIRGSSFIRGLESDDPAHRVASKRMLGDESIIVVFLSLIAGEAKRLEILHRRWPAPATRYDVVDFEPYGLVIFRVGSAFHTTIAIPLQDGVAEIEGNRRVKAVPPGFVALVELGFRKLS